MMPYFSNIRRLMSAIVRLIRAALTLSCLRRAISRAADKIVIRRSVLKISSTCCRVLMDRSGIGTSIMYTPLCCSWRRSALPVVFAVYKNSCDRRAAAVFLYTDFCCSSALADSICIRLLDFLPLLGRQLVRPNHIVRVSKEIKMPVR